MGNPYSNQTFFGFLSTLCERVVHLLMGSRDSLASDEVQLIVLSLLALSCTLIGTFLVQARKTMVANALSHTILLGIVLAFLLQKSLFPHKEFSEALSLSQLFASALIAALLTTVCTEYLSKKMGVQEDASIGLVFTLFFASGVLLLTLFARNVHLGSELVMGSVDSLYQEDIFPSLTLFLLNLSLFFLFFKEFTVSIFDPSFASLQGLKPHFFRYLLLFQTSLVAISAFQAIGVIMVLALFVAPTLIVRPFVKRLLPLIYLSALVAIAASLFSVALSRHIVTVYGIALSTGALLVCLLFVTYLTLRLTYTFLRTTMRHRLSRISPKGEARDIS